MKPTDRVQVRGVGGSFDSVIEAIEPGGGIVVRNSKGYVPDRFMANETHLLFMETQVELLVEWVENRRKP